MNNTGEYIPMVVRTLRRKGIARWDTGAGVRQLKSLGLILLELGRGQGAREVPNQVETKMLKEHSLGEIGKHDMVECGCQSGEKLKLKSGKYVKSNIDIKRQEQWPHMNVLRKYAWKCSFDNLDFDMFIAGETRIILNMTDSQAAKGRLEFLCRLSHWLCKCKDWNLVKWLYEGVIESVEMGEAAWTDDFGHYETMIPFAMHQDRKEVEEHRKGKDKRTEVFWCKGFQKNTCTDKAPHMSVIRNDEPPVPVLHVCASCLQREGKHEDHPECECPKKG